VELAVLDASVALAWVLPDEGLVEPVGRLMRAVARQEMQLAIPSVWPYEVAHGLRRAALRGRVDRSRAWHFLQTVLEVDVATYPASDVIQRAWWIAASGGITVYDACYLALAQALDCICLTADRKLANAAASSGLVRWIGDYE